MENYKLYVILDKGYLGNRDLCDIAQEVIEGGADVIQYRDKISPQEEILENSWKLKELKFPLIINDHPEIAKETDALGVHLGQGDFDIKTTREILGPKRVIGRSTHSLEQAQRAIEESADYIGIGPVFKTPTKKEAVPIGLEIVKKVAKSVKIPAFAIGGINLNNLDIVLSTGIKRIAIVSAILCSNNILKTTKEFSERLKNEPDRVCAQ